MENRKFDIPTRFTVNPFFDEGGVYIINGDANR